MKKGLNHIFLIYILWVFSWSIFMCIFVNYYFLSNPTQINYSYWAYKNWESVTCIDNEIRLTHMDMIFPLSDLNYE